MEKSLLHEDLKFLDIFRNWKYKHDFKKSHPYFFNPIGTMIFCGSQGKGKTLSAVNYIYQIMEAYPYCILCTNVALKDYPFSAHLIGDKVLYDDTHTVVNSDDILNGVYDKRVVVEYNGLDCLKFVNNGEYGVVYLIDEIHLELNSLESKNIDVDVMVEISQQRKQRKHIIGTSQVYMRLAKPLREQVFDIVLCNNYFKIFQLNKLINGETAKEDNGKLKCEVKGHYFYIHSPEMYSRYDTYAKMKRYSKEWQGRKRKEVVSDVR